MDVGGLSRNPTRVLEPVELVAPQPMELVLTASLLISLPPSSSPASSHHHYYNTGTGHAHADVTGRQIRTLQSVFKRLSNGEIDRVEGDWKYQLGSGGNKVVTAKQWQEILANGFVWIDFCCIPQVHFD